jgi:transposase, IS5 family
MADTAFAGERVGLLPVWISRIAAALSYHLVAEGGRRLLWQHAPKAQDFTNRRYRHRGVVDEVERAKNRTKSRVRARVEHSIGIIKRVFGFAKVRYRGLKKNIHRLLVTCALANLFMARRRLLRGVGA